MTMTNANATVQKSEPPCRRVASGCVDGAWRVLKLRLQEVRCPVERRSGFIEKAGKALKHMRDAGGDLEGHLDVGERCACGKPESVAQEDLVRTHLNEQRR